MAHIKAEILNSYCRLNGQCEYFFYDDEDNCSDYSLIIPHGKDPKRYIGGKCRWQDIETSFIERDYKRFTATEFTDYYNLGSYKLTVGRSDYYCTYLEIDGHVYCDNRSTPERDIEDRLRELVRGLDHCMRSTSSSSDECAGCPLQGRSTDGFQCTKSDRMRDLGIEVAQ